MASRFHWAPLLRAEKAPKLHRWRRATASHNRRLLLELLEQRTVLTSGFGQGFEVNNIGWNVLGGQYDATRVASGTHGVSSRSGAFHAEAGDVGGGSAFTRFGGYTTSFPAGGFHTSVSVYLNVGGSFANDTRFDWDSAINDAAGSFRRDFVFNAGYYNDSDATGVGPRFVISASNNAGRGSSFPKNPGRDPFTITTTGWYTLEETFTDGGGGVLKDTLKIEDSTGAVLHSWMLSNPTDIIGTTVGGNRYGWFASQEFPFLAFDDSLQANNVPPTTAYVDDDWTGLALGADPDGPGPATAIGYDAFATIQAGIDGAAAGGTVLVAAGTYNESPHLTKSITLAGVSRDTTIINLLSADAPSGTYLSSLEVSAPSVTISGFTIAGHSAVGSGLANSNIYIEPGLASVNIFNNRLKVGQIGGGSNGDDGFGILTTYTTTPAAFVGALNVVGNEIVPAEATANRAFYINPGVTNFSLLNNTISGEFDGRAISQANNADIENNTIIGTGASKGLGVWGYPDAAIFGHALIKDNDFGKLSIGVSVLSANNVTISNNTFTDTTTGILFDDSFSLGTSHIDYTTDVVHNNAFITTVQTPLTAIQNNTGAPINAANNWWGSPTGPSGPLNSFSDGTGAIVTGNAIVAPWLTDGTDTQPAVPGFQPNTASLAPITNDLGGAFSTIQAAIAGTPAGHTITLADGIYHESNILVNKSLTIQGQSRSGVILGPAMADGHQDSSFGGTVSNALVIGASGVTIRNMTIDGNQDATLPGTQNFRNAVITDYNNGDFGNIQLDHLSIQNIFRKGVGFYVVTAHHVSGDSIASTSFSNIGTDASLGLESKFAIAAFQSDTAVTDVDISHAGAGLGTNYFVSDAFAPRLTISGLTVHDMQTSGANPILGLDLSGLANGSSITASSIDVAGGTGHDIAAVIQYAASGADIIFSGNTITTDAADTGLYLYQDRDSAHPIVVENNTFSGAGSATGIVATDDGSIFGEGPHVGTTYATLRGNTISGYGTGVAVVSAGAKPVAVTVGGALAGDANGLTGGGSGTGISVSGASSTATIFGNVDSIHSFAIGIDVSGGAAAITGNHLYDNSIGVRFTSGGTGLVDGNNFAGGLSGPDNGTDLLLTSTAGTLTSLSGNAFAGNTFYIDDQGTQSVDLSTGGTTFDLTNNFRIEDHLHHRVDLDLAVTVGLVTWVANNLYVTTPGAGSTDSSIQRGIDAAAAGMTVNVEAGTYAENLTITKSLSLAGAQHGANAATRFGAFTDGINGPKADPAVETIVTAAINSPTAGNPNANDLIRALASNITIDGLVIDGNNPAIVGASTTQINGVDIDARRGITNIDAANNAADIHQLHVLNDILQNFGQRAISLSSSGAVLTGNLISGNVLRSFVGEGVIVFGNAYAEITNNTLDAPAGAIGLQLQNFFNAPGSMTWSGNQITVGQDGIGIHANLFYAPGGVLNIAGNTVNAAAGVTGASDFTWGINVWSVQAGATVNVSDNTVGSSGGEFARGINLWNLPTPATVAVGGGSVGNSLVGVNLDAVDPYFGGGSDSTVNVSGVSVAAKSAGLRVRNAPLLTPPQFSTNVPAGSVRVNLTGGTFTAAAPGAIGILIQDSTADAYTASVQIAGAPSITGGTTGLKLAGVQALLVGNTLAGATFSGQRGNYIALENGALAGLTIDGTAASFGGIVGNSATTSQGFAIEDKITHALDDGGLGFIRVKGGQVFVTPNSFVTPATTTADIQRGINAAASSDMVHVQAGTYKNNPIVTKPLTLLGANAGVAGGGVRGAETNVVTNGNQNAVFTVSASGVTIDGFAIDGDDPLVTGGLLASGNDANVNYGVRPSGAFSNIVVQNDIIQHVFVGFRGDGSNTPGLAGNLITQNWFDSIGNFDFGYAVSLRTGFYADVTNNLMTKVWTGVHLNDFHIAGPAAWSISGNTMQPYAGGILYWLQYGAATSATITSNEISAATGAVANNFGVLMVTVQDGIHPVFANNAISGSDYGIGLFNVPTTNNIVLDSTNSVSDAKLAGVLLTDKLNFNPVGTTNFLAGGPGAASTVKLTGMPITGAVRKGIIVDASGGTATNLVVAGAQNIFGVAGTATVGVDVEGPLASASLTAVGISDFETGINNNGGTLTFGGDDSITGGATGLAVSGATAAIAGQTLNNLSFFGQTGQHIALSASALGGQTIDGTAVSYGGVLGHNVTTAEGFAVEDKITDAIDNGALGFVRVKTGSVFVTPSSFVVPATTTPDIQRGVNAALAGDTINVAAGFYDNDVNLSKNGLALLGAGPVATTISGPIGGLAATVAVTASDVTIAGFTITRDGNNVAQWNAPGLNTAGISIIGAALTGMLVHDNLLTGNRTGIDINNSSGHTIRNNVLTDNRTGLILRNQTDNLSVVENSITNNWTVGIVFLDASGGTDSPVQSALNSTFSNNDISGNWYGQIVDRQTGGSLPTPGTSNLKDFSGNWFGTTTPVISGANSAEPGYAVHIPVEFGGSAVAPGSQPDIAGPGSANFDITPYLSGGTDTNVETTSGRGTFGFQGDFSNLIITSQLTQTGLTGRIQEGVNAATNGGTIHILAGSYAGDVDATASGKNVNLSPGASPAQITISGNLLLNAGDTLTIELNGVNPLTQYDNLVVNGGIDLGGATLAASLGFVPTGGTTFTIIDNDLADPVSGTFAGLPEGSPLVIGGFPFHISYAGGAGNNDVVLTADAPTVTYAEDSDWDLLPPGTIVDGDQVTAGTQTAIIGYNAFNTAAAIQDAVNAVAAGGTTSVNPGMYPEIVNVNKAVTILGAERSINPASRTAGGAAESTVLASGGSGFSISASGVTVRGFSITSGLGGVYGVAEVTPVAGTQIRENFLYGFTGGLGAAIAAGSTGFQIVENDVFNNYAGIYLSASASAGAVSGNFVHGHTGAVGADEGSGVELEGSNQNVSITQNQITGNRQGIYVWAPFGSNFSGTAIFGNSITANTVAGVKNTNAALIDASGNWWGANSFAAVAAQAGVNVDFTPWLNAGSDSDPTTRFQGDFSVLHVAAESPQVGTTGRIQEAVNLLTSGGTVNVLAGLYVENPNVNKAATLKGANTGLAGSSGRGAESIVRTNGDVITASINNAAVFQVTSNNVTIDGFMIDGDDPSVVTRPLASGDNADASYGVRPTGSISNLTVKNNIVTKVEIGLRGDAAASGNLITANWFDSIGHFDFGYAVSIRNNFYADVTNNKMTRAWTGVHINNFNAAGPATFSITGNEIHEYVGGILYWLEFNAATSATIANNNITAEAGAVAQNFGVLMVSIQDALHPSFTNNSIAGADYGIGLFNVSTSNFITLGPTNSVTGAKLAGVLLTNNLNFNPVGLTNFLAGGPGAASTVVIKGLPISTAAGADGIRVDATGGTATNLTFTNSPKVTGGAAGLRMIGATVGLTGNTLGDIVFSGQTGPYVALTNGALAGQTINGTAVSYGGIIGSDASTAQGYAIEDKLVHAIDDGSLGFVRITNSNVFVTPNSFVTPATTVANIQRAVAAAASGDTVNIAAGSYTGNVDAATPTKNLNFSPGASPAQVTNNGDLAWNAGDTLSIELNGASPVTGYDNLIVNGTVSLGGATLAISRSFVPSPGQSFTIVSNDGDDAVSGAFSGLPEGAIVTLGGIPLAISYAGGNGNDVTLTEVAPTTVYVNDTWVETANVSGGTPGVVELGDIVMSNTSAGDTAVSGLMFGYNAFATIGDGVLAVAVTGTVNVLAGSYVDNIAVNKSLHLVGQGGAVTQLVPAISAPLPAASGSLPAGASSLILIQASNVEITGLTLDGDNPGLTSGTVVNGHDIDARNGIIEDFTRATPFNNTHVHDVTVKNIFLRGIYASSGGSGFRIDNNALDNVQGSDQSIAIFNFGGSGEMIGNSVSNASDAISANHSRGTIFQNNVVTASGSGIHTDNSGDGGGPGDVIQNNQVSNGTTGAYGIFTFANYLPVLVKDNTIQEVTVGLAAFGQFVTTANTSFEHNTVSRTTPLAGSTGLLVSTSLLGFGFANAQAIITSNNDISGFDRGIANDQSGGGGFTTTLDIVNNLNSIHGNAIGIDLVGGTASISGNHLYSNGIGIQLSGGAAAAIDNNHFDGGGSADNGTDLLLTSSAGPVSSLSGNAFAGDTFFIDDQGTQSFNLSANGTTFDLTDNFRIEDHLHHGLDVDLPVTTGLVTWVAGNLFVTTPGVGSTDSSLQRGNDAASVGSTVEVEAGTYAENVSVNKPLRLLGANAGVNPNTGNRGAESVLITAVNDTTLVSGGGGQDEPNSPILHVLGAGSGVTIDGFVLDGVNPALGSQISASGGIYVDRVSAATIQNNIVQDFLHFGVSGLGDDGSSSSVSTNNLIAANKFQNIPGQTNFGYGEAIDAANNFYVSVTDNVISGIRRGMQLTNNYLPNTGSPMVISGNQLDVGQTGIWVNLWYGTASGLTISNNDLNSTFVAHTFPPAADNNRAGLFFSSLYSTIGAVLASGNTIHGGYDYGVLAWNNAQPITISGAAISGAALVTGVRLETSNATYGNASLSGILTLDAVQIQNAPTGIMLDDNSNNSSTIGLNLINGVQIGGGATGLALSGHDVGLTDNSLHNTQFTSQSGNYITLAASALGGQTIDSTAVSFDGLTGAAATLAQNYAIEDKITHVLDDASLGLIRVKAGNVFVTPLSGSIQRGIDAATAGDTVNVEAGAYVENISINKKLTLGGAGSGNSPATDTILQSATANVPVITVTGSGDSNADRLVLRDLRVTGAVGGGNLGTGVRIDAPSTGHLELNHVAVINNGGYGVAINSSVPLVDIAILNSTLDGNSSGFRIPTSGSLDGLTIQSTIIQNNQFGLDVNAANPGPTFLDHVTIADTQLLSNAQKGAYFEKLSNASFSNIIVSGNGTSPTSPAGIDLNLKFGSYANISFSGATFTGNGTGSASGQGLAIKGRDDVPPYSLNPATLSGVSLTNVSITGSPIDLSIGNRVAGLTLANVDLSGTGVGLDYYSDAADTPNLGDTEFAATLAGYLRNTSPNNVTATSATFGGLTGAAATTAENYAIEDKIQHGVDNGLAAGLVRVAAGQVFITPASFIAPQTAANLQNAISVAESGDTIHIAGGSYTGDVDATIAAKDLDFSPGASTSQVVIDGNLSLNGHDTLTLELNGLAALSDYDNFIVHGNVSLGSSNDGYAALVAAAGFTAAAGDVLVLIANESVPFGLTEGRFAGLAEGDITTINNQQFVVSYHGNDGNEVILRSAINVPPTLDPIADPPAVLEDAGAQTVSLTGISAGLGDVQSITITATSSNPGLIPNPTVNYIGSGTAGSLLFTPVANQSGTATITVTVKDDAGTNNGGVDTVTQIFTVTVTPVNDPPSFIQVRIPSANDDSGPQSVPPGWATISAGPLDEAGQKLTFTIIDANTNPAIFSGPVTIGADGTLSFTPLPNSEGTAILTVRLEDDGGTADGGVNFTTQQFQIEVKKPHRWHDSLPPYSPINRGSMEVLFEDPQHSITPTDVLLIINYLNSSLPTAIKSTDPIANGTDRPFYDVDGDDFVTPTDALLIINVLNAGQGGPIGGEGEGGNLGQPAQTDAYFQELGSRKSGQYPVPITSNTPDLASLIAVLIADQSSESPIQRRRR